MCEKAVPDVVVSFDPEGDVVVGLFYERAEPTEWLLFPLIPIEVPLGKVLGDVESLVSSRARSSGGSVSLAPDGGMLLEGNDPVSGMACENVGKCEGRISVARVGQVVDRTRAYCLLLEFSSCADALNVHGEVWRVKWLSEPLNQPKYVRAVGCIMDIEGRGGTDSCVNSCRSWRGRVIGQVSEEVCLRMLCSVSCGFDNVPGGKQLTGCELSLVSGVPRSAPLAPIEEFCSICHEEIACGRTCVVTMCNHVFHLVCLTKHLEDVSSHCPLCRFSMSSLESRCNACGTCQDLWTCLVCGWIGCGKGRHAHSVRHFECTGHSCAVQNNTLRIWNYRASTFLHHQLAMELGHEDDAKAARAAAAEKDECSVVTCCSGEKQRVCASSYWRSRWWWDEKEEEAAQELNGEYVREYYLRVMEELVQEQADHFEGRTTVEGRNVAVPIGTWKKLLNVERRQRRSIVSRYVSGLRRMALDDRMVVDNYVKQELLWRDSLRDELLLQSHAIQGLSAKTSTLRESIESAKRRGEQQVARKQSELRTLQERLESLMRNLE